MQRKSTVRLPHCHPWTCTTPCCLHRLYEQSKLATDTLCLPFSTVSWSISTCTCSLTQATLGYRQGHAAVVASARSLQNIHNVGHTHYTGSTSSSPGYLSRLRPAIPNTVWKTSTMSPGRSANPPSSGSCSIQRRTHNTTMPKRLTWHCKMNCVSFWPSIQCSLSSMAMLLITHQL